MNNKIKQQINYQYPKPKEIKKQLDELWEIPEMKELKEIIEEWE